MSLPQALLCLSVLLSLHPPTPASPRGIPATTASAFPSFPLYLEAKEKQE